MKLDNFQKSKLFKYLSTYFAFVFIVLQLVDILSEPFSLPQNFIVYLVYIFAAVLILLVIFVMKGDKAQKPLEHTEKQVQNKYITPLSLSIIAVLLIMNGYQFFSAKISGVRTAEISSKLENFITGSNYLSAFQLYNENVGNPVLEKRLDEFSREVKIASRNSDVKTFVKYDLDKLLENKWEFLCDVPCDVRIPLGRIKYKFEASGYNSFEAIRTIYDSLYVDLIRSDSVYNDMVWIKGINRKLRVAGLDHLKPEAVSNYQIDKYEVTNEDYAKFILNGGYKIDSLWNFKELEGSNYKELFIDKTGFNGPSTWELGSFPENKSNYPVSGISWFEAMAYCKSIGKSLPNIYQWDYAATLNFSGDITPRSNIQSEDKIPVGSKRITSGFGLYDVAGNVSEWISNESDNSSKVIMGGSWKDPGYIFNTLYSKDPFDRDSGNGCRCVYSEENNQNLYKVVKKPSVNFVNVKPVAEDVFKAYLSMFQYSKYDFQATTLKEKNLENYNIKKISYTTPYGENMFSYIYTPVSITKPAKTVVFFPGANAINRESSSGFFEQIPSFLKFFMKLNMVVVHPIYASTFERRDGLTNSVPFYDLSYRDRIIKWSKDLQTTVDYLMTTDYVDKNYIHYFGFSWGARIAGIMLATESRFKSALLYVGGLRTQNRHPEADPINYLPRVKIPVLMINGKYDAIFPFETQVVPMFDLLGTPKNNKKLITFEGGHELPKNEQIRNMIDWFELQNK